MRITKESGVSKPGELYSPEVPSSPLPGLEYAATIEFLATP